MIIELPEGLIFEALRAVAPLGLRFWDAVTSTRLPTGLRVTAAPTGQPRQSVVATPTSSGSYGFVHLPGLRTLEQGEGDQAYWAGVTAATQRAYTIAVSDLDARVFPFTLQVRAPHQDVYSFACTNATVSISTPNAEVPLFSLPSRPVPAGMAVIRCEVTRAGEPAAWAFLEVRQGAALLGQGLADREGRAAIIFPYPRATQARSLLAQEWVVTVHVFSSPVLNNQSVVDLCAVLSQPDLTQQDVTVRYRQELVLKIGT